MARPRKPDRLVKVTVAVPVETRAAMVEAGPDAVREALQSGLPTPDPESLIIAILEAAITPCTARDIAERTDFEPAFVRKALKALQKEGIARKVGQRGLETEWRYGA